MTRPVAMARFDLAWPLAGMLAALMSMAVLAVLCVAGGLPPWMFLNATTHALYGAEAARTTALDLRHTGLGAVIHIAACFFWAALAVLALRKTRQSSASLAWIAGLATAAIAGIFDFAILPARLNPGWDLVLPPLGVALGLVGMGTGLALGLVGAQSIAGRTPLPTIAPDLPQSPPPPPEPRRSALQQMRHPGPHVIDQRQQRIDPAGKETLDLNKTTDPWGHDAPPLPDDTKDKGPLS